MTKYYLSKYPVISEKGNLYRVDICEDRLFEDTVVCTLYKKERGIFGGTKWERLNGGSFNRSCYCESSWEYDYVEIAKEEVKKYEKLVDTQKDSDRKRREGMKKFGDWGGEVSE